jgi:hypothetical protein
VNVPENSKNEIRMTKQRGHGEIRRPFVGGVPEVPRWEFPMVFAVRSAALRARR